VCFGRNPASGEEFARLQGNAIPADSSDLQGFGHRYGRCA
jgi:hypothetical protein